MPHTPMESRRGGSVGFRRRLWRRVPVLLLLVGVSCSGPSTAPVEVVARVNGVDIPALELEERYARNIQGVDPPPDADEADDLKLQLLNEIITDEIIMQLAADRKLTATDEEVDVRFNEFKSQYSPERFEEILDAQKMTAQDVRDELRASLTIEKLINMEITSRISVSDADIAAFYERNKSSFDLPERFRVSHILITPVAEPDLNNLEGDDATNAEQARAKAVRLLNEIQEGADFGTLARRYSEDPSTVIANGDLGFQPMESIAGVDPALAEAIGSMRVGETFPSPVETRFGFHLLQLVDRDPGGQKDHSDPRVEADIRQIIFNRRDQLLRGAFYERARNNATIENFFAERVLARRF